MIYLSFSNKIFLTPISKGNQGFGRFTPLEIPAGDQTLSELFLDLNPLQPPAKRASGPEGAAAHHF